MMHWLTLKAMEALMPRAEGMLGVRDTPAEEFLERLERECTGSLRVSVHASVLVFHSLPPLVIGVPLPAFLLPDPWLDRYADEIARHRVYLVRQSAFLIKMVAGLCWGADEDVRRSFNLPAYESDPGTWRAV